MTTYSMKVTPANAPHLPRLFYDRLKGKGGMGISFGCSTEHCDGYKYEVLGFDSDGDVVISDDNKKRTVSRSTLLKSTIHAEVDIARAISNIVSESDASAMVIINRFHVERVFRIGDRVRFVPELTPGDAPNAPLYVVDMIEETPRPASFDEPARDVLLLYPHSDGTFNMFPTDSRLLEIDR